MQRPILIGPCISSYYFHFITFQFNMIYSFTQWNRPASHNDGLDSHKIKDVRFNQINVIDFDFDMTLFTGRCYSALEIF